MNYYLIILSILIVAYLENKYLKNLYISIVLILLIYYFRYDSGVDFASYYEVYNEIQTDLYYKFDAPFFYYLTLFFNREHISYRNYLFVISLIHFMPIIYIMHKKIDKRMRWLFVFLYLIIYELFFSNLSLLRQSIAISFVFLALNIKNKFIFNRILLIIVATLFHKSAIIFFIFLFFKPPKNIKKFLRIFLILIFIFIIFYSFSFEILGEIFDLIGLGKYKGYLYVSNFKWSFRQILKILVIFLYFPIIKIIILNYNKKNRKESFFLLLGLICNFMIILNFNIVHRCISYFYLFYLVYIPCLMKQNKKDGKLIITILCIFFIINHAKFYFSSYNYFMGNIKLKKVITYSDIEESLKEYHKLKNEMKRN